MLDLVPIISYNYISASFEVLSLSKTIKLNGTCTGKSKYGDPVQSISEKLILVTGLIPDPVGHFV
jgi:hypothetical protein